MEEERQTGRRRTAGNSEMWRLADVSSQQVLEEWLTGHFLDGIHEEPGLDGSESYQHPGYHAVDCLVCHQATIVGNGQNDVICGRHTCEVPLLVVKNGGEA